LWVPDSGKTDAGLIERCRGGDADAWDALFDKYYPVAARFRFPVVRRLQSRRHGRNLPGDLPRRRAKPGIISRQEFFSKRGLLRVAANKALDFRGKSRAEKRGGNVVQFSLDGARASGPNRSAIGMSRAGYRGDKCRKLLVSFGKASISWRILAGKSSSCVTMAS
jgi:hypothetical protein